MHRKKKMMEVSDDMDTKNENEVIRVAMKARGLTQTVLAEKVGTAQNSLSNAINRSRMSVQWLKKILDAMGFDLVVVDRKTGKQCWRIGV